MAENALVNRMRDNYRYMLQSRYIDAIEEEMTSSGEAFFHVSGGGHEAVAVLNDYLIADDWLHCHYRDKSLMLARGISVEMFFLATLNKDSSHSRGRQMNAHMTAREFNILSLVGPVGNNALQAVGIAEIIRQQKSAPIVLCAMGDGTTQQGEVLEAIGHAVRETLPILFLIEDNALAISTQTDRQTFFSTPDGDQSTFQGVPITHIDGSNIIETDACFRDVVKRMRKDRKPQIIRCKMDRLSHHTNADDQRVYRTAESIERARSTRDPIAILRAWLIAQGTDADELRQLESETEAAVAAAAERARNAPEPQPTFEAKKDLVAELVDADAEYRGHEDGERYTMLEAIRATLDHHLQHNDNVMLFGEDIEDPKGDVFGVTKGLSTRFPDRVRNSPLAEASVVGISIGHALAGAHPVAFLQFADFLPIAYNQIFSEMGSMYWRTNGSWQVPMIVMLTCGAYRPGLGPFHASSMESIAAHTPGVDVFMPSTAADAAGLLNAAFKSRRPTLFFYPKSCLNDREKSTSTDIPQQLVPIGQGRKTRTGEHLTFVGWGNTVGLCEKSADVLADHGIQCDVIDLRSIVPWDVALVTQSVRVTRRLIIVHEDNHTVGMGAEVAATIAERLPIGIEIRRITRPDTYVPCNFANQLAVLPSFKKILETAVALCDGEIEWQQNTATPTGMAIIEAIGSSPSDETITVIRWLVAVGDPVQKGQIIAEVEADKAATELRAGQSGIIDTLNIAEGEMIKVGETLGMIKVNANMRIRKKQITKEEPGIPIIRKLNALRTRVAASRQQRKESAHEEIEIGIVDIACKTGSRIVSNEEIATNIPQWNSEDIVRRTGIKSRNWIGQNESALTLAVDATRQLVKKTGLAFNEIGLILCSTETPLHHTPSMATLVQSHIKDGDDTFLCPAYDVNAACAGYIYTLQVAYDFLCAQPDSAVLLITAEALSTRLDLSDPSTAPIFADASTATLLVSNRHRLPLQTRIFRPIVGANGEDGTILNVPIPDNTYIKMEGQHVFRCAVRDMIASLKKACSNALVELSDLTKIVAHQANQRILNAISTRLKLKDKVMFSNIKHLGNTSSSTIPLCLNTVIHELKKNQYIGLTAFGGGFTFGGAILKSH